MNHRIKHMETYRQALQLLCIANRAVHEAQAESRRLNVSNVFSRNKQLFYDPPARQGS